MSKTKRLMKDSGMPWVGLVPAYWFVEKVKHHLRRNEPRNPGNQQVLSVYREYGVIPKDSRDDNHNVTSEDTSKYKYVKPGNLVINKMKAWQGSMGVSNYEGIVSPAYFVYYFTDNTLFPRYLHHLFRGCYKDEFRRISGGIREGQWDLSPEAFANTLLLIPPLSEQKRIATYLDAKCGKIDSIIAGEETAIEKLKAYKQSLITETVTKGLNPKAPMKDSGIEWIGEIPEGWNVGKLKSCCNINGRIGFRGYTQNDLVSAGDGPITLSPSNITENGICYDKCSYLTWAKYDESPEIQVENGDILYVKTGSSYGKSCLVTKLPLEATINPQLVVIKDISIETHFLMYYLQSALNFYQKEIAVVGGTIPTMSQTKLGNFYIIIPPPQDQLKVCNYLDKKCGAIDSNIASRQSLIEKLTAYKKSLIYEVVTGKKEV